MSVVAAAVIGSAVVGGVVANSASKRAADAQKNASDSATQLQWDMYDQNREDLAPWRDAGATAIGQLGAGTKAGGDYMRDFTLADFNRDPGYQFRMDQGTKAVEASAAARGGVLSGGNLKDVMGYGQDFASGEYTNAYNRWNADRDRRFGRLSQIAGIGQATAGQIADQGAQAAGRAGEYMTQGANARASGYIGQANAINQGLGTIGNYFQNQAYQQPQSAQQWWGSGAAPGGASAGFGTSGLNSFFLGNGTGGD